MSFMKDMNIILPSPGQCLKLLQQHNVPEHVQEHSCCVALVTSNIASELAKKGVAINKDLVLAASLLHDIAKIECLNNGRDHCTEGAKLLSGLGLFDIADIVRQHVKLDKICMATNLPAMLVNYSDKRVKHNEIVTLEERFNDIKERYVKTEKDLERIKRLYMQTKEVEDLLFKALDSNPDDILFLEGQFLDSCSE